MGIEANLQLTTSMQHILCIVRCHTPCTPSFWIVLSEPFRREGLLEGQGPGLFENGSPVSPSATHLSQDLLMSSLPRWRKTGRKASGEHHDGLELQAWIELVGVDDGFKQQGSVLVCCGRRARHQAWKSVHGACDWLSRPVL